TMKKTLCLSLLLLTVAAGAQAQDAVAHARQVLELLRQEKFADLVKEFDAQMTAGLPPQALAQTWASLRAQVGDFKSEVGQQSAWLLLFSSMATEQTIEMKPSVLISHFAIWRGAWPPAESRCCDMRNEQNNMPRRWRQRLRTLPSVKKRSKTRSSPCRHCAAT